MLHQFDESDFHIIENLDGRKIFFHPTEGGHNRDLFFDKEYDLYQDKIDDAWKNISLFIRPYSYPADYSPHEIVKELINENEKSGFGLLEYWDSDLDTGFELNFYLPDKRFDGVYQLLKQVKWNEGFSLRTDIGHPWFSGKLLGAPTPEKFFDGTGEHKSIIRNIGFRISKTPDDNLFRLKSLYDMKTPMLEAIGDIREIKKSTNVPPSRPKPLNTLLPLWLIFIILVLILIKLD